MTWLNTHQDTLAKTVDNIALSDNTNLQAAISVFVNLSNDVKAKLKNEKAHLKELNIKVKQLQWEQDHASILAKTVDNVAESDWAAIDNAYKKYNQIARSAGHENMTYLKSRIDHLVKLTKKIASPEAIAYANKFAYLETMSLDKVSIDNIVDYYFAQKEAADLPDGEKADLILFNTQPKLEKTLALMNQDYQGMLSTDDTQGDAKTEFMIALLAHPPRRDHFVVNKIALKDSKATKMSGVELKDVVWSRDIELLDASVPQLTKPARIYVKINNQKVIDLLKAGKLEMVHVHKKADGTFETTKTPIAFNERYNVLAFSTDKFSEFALVIKGESNLPTLPNTGVYKTDKIALTAFGLFSLLAIGFVIKK